MSTLVVIGGSGFFGKSILDAFGRGLLTPWKIDRIEVVSRQASALSKSNPELLSKEIFLHDIDITKCTQLPVGDYVIHAAASTDAQNYLQRPAQEKKNIQLGASNFCLLVKNLFSNSKILYVSSGAVYGQQPETISHIEEDAELQTIASLESGKRDYAAAKRDGERFIQELGIAGYDVAIARCFAFVGLYLPRNQHFAIGNFIEDGLQGRAVEVKARHFVYRSYLYADDLVLWLMKLVAQASPSCPIVNVGSDESVLIGDLATIVAHQFGQKALVPELSNSSIDRYVPSIDKALKMGCRTPRNLNAALVDTIKAIEKQKLL